MLNFAKKNTEERADKSDKLHRKELNLEQRKLTAFVNFTKTFFSSSSSLIYSIDLQTIYWSNILRIFLILRTFITRFQSNSL